jgi:molybdate transport system ATP-binding protein
VDQDFPPGITVILGPSGSGKSTLLAAIAGLGVEATGRIALGENVWLDSSVPREVPVHERRLAVVFQSLALFPHMTGLANVAFGIDRRLDPQDREARARRALRRFRAESVAERLPATFSGGEAQRVALARAIAMNPGVLLLDEPFSAMDDTLRFSLVAEVRELAEELRIPVLAVTHHRGEARRLAQWALRMDQGTLHALSLEELRRPERAD